MNQVQIYKNGSYFGSAGLANRYFLRLRGLIGRDVGALGGLWIVPCNQIHMFFMQYPLDIVYLDRDGIVLKAEEAVPTGKICKPVRKGHHVLELPTGTIQKKNIQVGDIITYEPHK